MSAAFPPGDCLNTLGLENALSKISPDYNIVGNVKVPGRVGWSVCDMNCFAPGRPGGGGVGMAIGVYSHAIVSLQRDAKEDTIHCERPALIAHFIALFRKVTGFEGGFFIRAYSDMGNHVGLGSTSSIVLAVLHGMNVCLGKPMQHEQLRQLLGFNYVEERDGLVAFGYETGMTGLGACKGGMFALSDHIIPIYHYPFAEDAKVYVILPEERVKCSGEEEDQLLREGKVPDSSSAQVKAYIMCMELPIALQIGDLVKVGEVIWKLQTCGSKTTEINKHGKNVGLLMNELHDLKIGTVGMSSVGPAVIMVTRQSRDFVDQVVKKHNCKVEYETIVDNTGVVIKAYPPIDLIYVQGPPGSGKTTVCTKLATATSELKFFSVGELIRNKRQKDPHSKEAKILARIQDTGEVADVGDITTDLVLNYIDTLTEPDRRNIFLLDGFPRTAKQIFAFEPKIKIGTKLLLRLDCPGDERMRRITARSSESGRTDDASHKLVAKRFEVDETDQIIAYYQNRHTINTAKDPEEVFNESKKIINTYFVNAF